MLVYGCEIPAKRNHYDSNAQHNELLLATVIVPVYGCEMTAKRNHPGCMAAYSMLMVKAACSEL